MTKDEKRYVDKFFDELQAYALVNNNYDENMLKVDEGKDYDIYSKISKDFNGSWELIDVYKHDEDVMFKCKDHSFENTYKLICQETDMTLPDNSRLLWVSVSLVSTESFMSAEKAITVLRKLMGNDKVKSIDAEADSALQFAVDIIKKESD